MPWWMRSSIVMMPEGMGGAGAPPAGSQGVEDTGGAGDAGGQELSYIDEATNEMLADDMPDGWQQPSTQPTPAPQYPEPVRVGQQQPAPQRQAQPGQQTPQFRSQARPGQVPGQQQAPAQMQQQAPQAPPAPAGLQSEADRQAEEIRRDPFAFQANLLQQQEQAYTQALAENVYKISEADMDAFLSGDSTKVSQALARVHINAVGSAMKVVSQYMPIWVGNMLRLHQTANDAEKSFWDANPDLNRQTHNQLAQTAARAYRQINPRATSEEMNRVVGAMVMAAAGVTPGSGFRPGPVAQHQLPNGVRTPGRVVRNNPPGFQPAGMQAVSGARPALQSNPWGDTAEIILADDRGAFDGQM